ncbi:XdhC family protein [Acidovorax sp. NCPPB 3859]|nr:MULTISPECIES: XdhC family protein [unclassified Acidovorax]MDA8448324.1 XdhC family protein [Acidovorax sp. GBBC 3297]MDA8457709.1 XdhC family protein [Acidovorax sp. GBBC 3333]MDA8462767.1 XdhC family protein [Acidovorax sp. GBBC 3332]MDA8467779.1 XdhC family protein [Acidovorax sp. GBBC 3299]WCM77799.1 XdhC family protein [Acidovorax sp. GBBC 712]
MEAGDLDSLVLRTANGWLQAGVPAWLVTVARTWGSSPRPPGSLMAMNARGDVAGSVSGGCIEDDLVRRVQQQATAQAQAEGAAALPEVLRYGISADEAHRFGLPCGGTVELVMEPLRERSRLPELMEVCARRRCVERTLHLATGNVVLREAAQGATPQLDAGRFVACFAPVARLVVIGAGDTAYYACRMALAVGFDIVLCDPRLEQAPAWAQGRIAFTRDMPDDVVLALRDDDRTAVLALSHDPKLDDLALIEALRSRAFYVGAIGSRGNSARRRERLQAHFGLEDAELRRLHGPAGLFIGSRTPAEIALSMMAEVVAAKNGVPGMPR